MKEVYGQIPKLHTLRNLYGGALATGVRQFGYWEGYSISEQAANHLLETFTSINPHAPEGIIVKSWPQSLFLTTPIYIFQRLINELQYSPNLAIQAREQKKRRYTVVLQDIISNQGKKGLFKGFFAKVASNSILILGVSILLEQGRSALKKAS